MTLTRDDKHTISVQRDEIQRLRAQLAATQRDNVMRTEECGKVHRQLAQVTAERDEVEQRYLDAIRGRKDFRKLCIDLRKQLAELEATIAEIMEDPDAFAVARTEGESLPSRIVVALKRMEAAEKERIWPSYEQLKATVARLEQVIKEHQDESCEEKIATLAQRVRELEGK